MSKTKPEEHNYMFKIILVGSCFVGKSNIILRFTRNQYNEHHQMTIGV
jgi:GTPase SAR1 family protein